MFSFIMQDKQHILRWKSECGNLLPSDKKLQSFKSNSAVEKVQEV